MRSSTVEIVALVPVSSSEGGELLLTLVTVALVTVVRCSSR